MLNTIIRYIQGYLLIRVTGYSPERFLNLCSRKQIYLWGLEPKENSYEMFITIRGFRKLKPILKKTRTKVTILNRLGLPFFFHRYRKRKVFFFGILFCLIFIYVMSLFVWNIHIEGNFTRTDEVILEFLESKHIKHGMLKKKVNCERIVKDIRKEFDDIVWVSAYVTGTRLMIQVKENTDTFPMEAAKEEPPNDIVADKDGRITSIVTRNGVPCVKPGDEVKKGDILVSGKVEVKNDAGEIVNYHYQNADADIEAETTLEYENEHRFSHSEKKYTDVKKKAFYLRVGNYLGPLGGWKNRYQEAEIYTSERRLKIGEHFYLPISWGIREIRQYESKEKVYTQEEMRILLSEEFQLFCKELEEKKIEILQKDVKIYLQKNSAKAKGTLRVREKIGEHKETEKIDF
ncbi:MAG: sporulation protein YqfD [[Clostridium] nexile]